MTKTKYWLSILAVSVVLIAGSLAVSPIAIADDDDDDDDDDDNGQAATQSLVITERTGIPVSAPFGTTTAGATCNADEMVVGGGYSITNNAQLPVGAQHTLSDQASGNGWSVTVQSSQVQTNILTVKAMCAKLVP